MDLLLEITVIALLTSSQFILSNASPNSSNNSAINALSKSHVLLSAHVVYRHGDRNIAVQYPNDPYRFPHHWPGGIGQLTKEGKMQVFKLGQYFKRRYNSLLGDKYSPNSIYIRSTDIDRTLMSAQVNLAGLFPPSKSEQWNEEIIWQPIPVHTVPVDDDHLLYGGRNCPKYGQTFAKYVSESEEVHQIYADNVELFSYWSEKCGSSIKTIKEVQTLYKTLSIEKLKNKVLPNWANQAIIPNGTMERIALFHYQMATDTPELARLRCGLFFKEMLDHFTLNVDSSVKVWLYSAHETTIGDLLNSLGIFKLHIPPYASSLHFELYKNNENQLYIQLFYRTTDDEYPAPINIPGCGTECHLNRFNELYKHIIPVDVKSECQLTQSFVTN